MLADSVGLALPVARNACSGGTARLLDLRCGLVNFAVAFCSLSQPTVRFSLELRRSVRDEGRQGVTRLCGAPPPSGWPERMRSRRTTGRIRVAASAGRSSSAGRRESRRPARPHGLAIDNLLAAEVVTAEGRIVRASADEHADLFWALRGGGNFGGRHLVPVRSAPRRPDRDGRTRLLGGRRHHRRAALLPALHRRGARRARQRRQTRHRSPTAATPAPSKTASVRCGPPPVRHAAR